MIVVECSPACSSEVNYILGLILGDVLGLKYEVRYRESCYFKLIYSGKEITLPNAFFSGAEDDWLGRDTLPKEPLQKLVFKDNRFVGRLEADAIPVIYGEAKYECNNDSAFIGIDIFGSAFYMLSLYDEVVSGYKDDRGRFPFSKSLTCREGFISRPIINEYIEILWETMSRVFSDIKRRTRDFRFIATQDVDNVFFAPKKNMLKSLKLIAGDVLKRRSILLAARRLCSLILPEVVAKNFDAYATYEFFMTALEQKNLEGEFFFIPGATNHAVSAHYDINAPSVLGVIKSVSERGHAVGVHPFYGSYKNSCLLAKEKNHFDAAIKSIDLKASPLGGRHHGLQWEAPTTWKLWDDLGFEYDSSVSFAEHPGFRVGFCYEYRVYDTLNRKQLDLHERPLICMDTTYMSYLGCNREDYVQSVLGLIEVCRKYNGDFVGLWHNCKLSTRQAREDFLKILSHINK